MAAFVFFVVRCFGATRRPLSGTDNGVRGGEYAAHWTNIAVELDGTNRTG